MRESFFYSAVIILSGVLAAQLTAEGAQPPVQSAAGSFRYVATVRDVMHVIVEPAADALFDAVATSVTADGIKEQRPETDEDWDALEHSAIVLAEAANLLKMEGRPIARPEEMNVDPDGPELPPAEIAKRVSSSRAAWNAYADAMLNAALQALKHIEAKDPQGILLVSEAIDGSCESCHKVYWYPEEKRPNE